MVSPINYPNAAREAEPVILIVNGDQTARNWIEATVRAAGLRARCFDSAAELTSCFAGDTAACAILDVTLPDASGFELQGQLTRAGATVLFLTREHCIASCVRAIKSGAVDFLTLPCDSSELVQALRQATRQALASRAHRELLDELRSRYQRLTRREHEVFALVSNGMLNKQIAQRLDISEVTVQIHRGRVMKKMGARSFAALIRMADTLQPSSHCSCPGDGPQDRAPAPIPLGHRHCGITCLPYHKHVIDRSHTTA